MISAYKSKDKFIINVPYCDKEKVKDIGGRWDTRYKKWWVPASYLSYKQLVNIGCSFNKDTSKDYLKKKESLIIDENNLKTKPYEHQRKLLELALDKKKSFFLCEVGTGKSKPAIDAISILYAQGKIKKALIICPASILANTKKEICIHSDLDAVILYGSLKKRKDLLAMNKHHIYIINYDVLAKMKKEIIAANFDLMVFDEVHYLKNPKSNRSEAAYEIAKGIEYKIGLTGTLISNNFQDAFMPYKVIDERIFGSIYNIFKNRYLIMGGYNAGFGGTEVIGYVNKEEFKSFIAKISLKYELDDITDLPEVIDNPIEFDLTTNTLKLYKQMKKTFKAEFGGKSVSTSNVLDKMLKLSKISSGFIEDGRNISNEKLELLCDIIKSLEGKKCIIWCRFTHSIDRIKRTLEDLGYKSMVYDGRTKDKGCYIKFNESDDYQIFISQLQMGIGFSIPTAKHAIFYELDFSLQHLIQAKGRNRRLKGSEHGSCVYTYLLGNKTIDQYIYNTLQNKDFDAKEALEYVKS